MILIKAGCSI